MKTLIFTLGIIGLTVLTASAQDDRKLRNDVTYSTHNYKHANKAATAKRWTTDKSLEVTPPSTAVNQLANYKHQMPGLTPVGGVVLPHTLQTDVASRNYKIQRVSEPVPESTQEISAKPQSKETSAGNE
ncbi:hypothetical protein [Spirosoma validum]|uniref:Uncharacterized protein n=1 Tax=Spirosoma validum TaxID=2771355 RepID=A0A927GEX3_9BACT|nr:hypothetical protein [Spirosoma validum]MBD2755096.1 hypothetical protein [Spirosoma validum]